MKKNIKAINNHISNENFDTILKYINGEIVNIENVETKFNFDLMKAADEFDQKTRKSSRNNFKILKIFVALLLQSIQILFLMLFTSRIRSAWVSLLKRDVLQLEAIKNWCLEQNKTLQEILDKQLESAIYGIIKGILGGYDPLAWNANTIYSGWISVVAPGIF
ncbi:hypothetical protein Glove_132g98 [Diversispora epigaea]|uniref:Uncharacterized protein n=1 Tax=Diversispora epigaea TaxID=1348612 RepID=A0A397J289_9GLOM|nr:hypothetical protein Glove_132g98 [Diversispora epigaea]